MSRSAKLLQSFTVEGVSCIDESDIVRDRGEPTSAERIAAAVAAAGGKGGESGMDYESVLARSHSLNTATASEMQQIGEEVMSAQQLEEQQEHENDGEGDEDIFGGGGGGDGLTNIAEGSREEGSVATYSAAVVIENPDDGIVRRTKRQFKAEYLKRKLYRDDVVAKIIERERRIAKISQSMEKILTELFFVALFDTNTQRSRILPVLGISYPQFQKSNLLQVNYLYF